MANGTIKCPSSNDITINSIEGVRIDYVNARKSGRAVSINFRFKVDSTVSGSGDFKIATISGMQYCPTARTMAICYSSWNASKIGVVYIEYNGDIMIIWNSIARDIDYLCNFSYITSM